MIVILDFGSQYTQLIARRTRELGVYCEIHPCFLDHEKIKALNPQGLILSGGPNSVFEKDSPQIDPLVFGLGCPILGVCYGQQLIVHTQGGAVEKATHREYGKSTLSIHESNPLFHGIDEHSFTVWMSHGDRVAKLPEGFSVCGTSENSPYAAISNLDKNIYGIQFHPEVSHSQNGTKIISNFLFEICKLKSDWSIASFLETKKEELKKQIGDSKVLCALSGGVDSSVVAILLHEAIGDQLECIFVDTGFLRKGEAEKVESMFRQHYKINLQVVDAKKLFYSKLEGVSDPEVKRKTIGNLFIEVFEEEAKKLGKVDFLAQGTLYPDVIESVSFTGGPSVTIKSHHNVGGLPEKMNLDLVEPLRELFKDEVRELGKELGLPEEFVHRHPFPGPGLAIRILGDFSEEKVKTLQDADAIILEELKKAGLYRKVWQTFGVLLPVKSVGVMGDARTYEWTLAIRSVDSIDAMTADWSRLPYDLIALISNRVINEVPKINRVVYDVTSKPPGTIEWE